MHQSAYCVQVIFALQHLQTVSPHPKFNQTCLCTKEIAWNIGNHPVLNSPAEGERGKNKTRANISLYTVFHYLVLEIKYSTMCEIKYISLKHPSL